MTPCVSTLMYDRHKSVNVALSVKLMTVNARDLPRFVHCYSSMISIFFKILWYVNHTRERFKLTGTSHRSHLFELHDAVESLSSRQTWNVDIAKTRDDLISTILLGGKSTNGKRIIPFGSSSRCFERSLRRRIWSLKRPLQQALLRVWCYVATAYLQLNTKSRAFLELHCLRVLWGRGVQRWTE